MGYWQPTGWLKGSVFRKNLQAASLQDRPFVSGMEYDSEAEGFRFFNQEHGTVMNDDIPNVDLGNAEAMDSATARGLIAQLEIAPEEYAPVPFSEERANEEFSTNVQTAVGEIKFGEHQDIKLVNLNRTGFLGMIRPTLERPSLILREPGKSKNGKDAFEFFKVFKTKDSPATWFFSVAINNSEVKGLVIISSRRTYRRQLEGRMMKFPLAYSAATGNQQAGNDGQRQGTVSTRLNQNLPSDSASVNEA